MLENKVVWLAVVSMFFYGVSNVLFEKKFSNLNLYAVQTYTYAAMLLISVIGWLFSKQLGQNLSAPKGSVVFLVIFGGLMFFVADTLYLGAYNKNYGGGTIFIVTAIVVMFPVVAGLIKNVWDGGLPNKWQVVSYLFAALAVLAGTKGNK